MELGRMHHLLDAKGEPVPAVMFAQPIEAMEVHLEVEASANDAQYFGNLEPRPA